MHESGPPVVPVGAVRVLPGPPAGVFRSPGFGPDAFRLLDELNRAPHIGTYRRLKDELGVHITRPFKEYRDDHVAAWVLPNRLDLETERNVFSRFLKNDFGAGGCHSHLWMSFYRSGRSRLKDIQLAHSLGVRGLTVGLYLARRMGAIWRPAREALGSRDVRDRLVEPLLARGFNLDAQASEGIWLRTLIPRARVLKCGKLLAAEAYREVQALWPVYAALSDATEQHG